MGIHRLQRRARIAETRSKVWRPLVFLLQGGLNWFRGLVAIALALYCSPKGKGQVRAYIDELLQILVKTCEIVFSLFVLGDQSLLLFEQNLSFLLESFPFRVFVVNSSGHHALLIFLGVLGILLKEFLDWDER